MFMALLSLLSVLQEPRADDNNVVTAVLHDKNDQRIWQCYVHL